MRTGFVPMALMNSTTAWLNVKDREFQHERIPSEILVVPWRGLEQDTKALRMGELSRNLEQLVPGLRDVAFVEPRLFERFDRIENSHGLDFHGHREDPPVDHAARHDACREIRTRLARDVGREIAERAAVVVAKKVARGKNERICLPLTLG